MIRKHAGTWLFVSTLLFSTSLCCAAGDFKFHQVAQSGMAAPVPPQLSIISSFSFNDHGEAAFIADNGLLIKSGDTVRIIAGFSQAAPGGGHFISAATPSLNNSGDVVFRAEVSAPGASGLFLYSNGVVSQFLPDGTTGPSGEALTAVNPVLNSQGTVAFLNSVTGPIYEINTGSIVRLAGPGDSVPGAPGDTFLRMSGISINSSGQVAFTGAIAPFGHLGIFMVSGSVVTRIIGPGDSLPDGSAYFFADSNPSINDAGQVAVGLVAVSFGRAVYLYSDGQLQPVLRMPTTAFPDGAYISGTTSVSMNNAADIAIVGSLGMFLLSNGNLSELAGLGGRSPDGNTYTIDRASLFNAVINNAGQVLFGFSEDRQADALYLFSSNQVTRFAGAGDPVSQQPVLEFPFAFGIAGDNSVLISDTTFPGGTGLYKTDAKFGSSLQLVAHAGEPFAENAVAEISSFMMNQRGQVAIEADTSATRSEVLLGSGGSLTTITDQSRTVIPTFGSIALNNIGETVFQGFTGEQFGLFLSSNGQTSELLNSSTTVAGLGTLNDLENLSLNDHDDVVFLARFPAGNVFYQLSQGNLIRLAGDGDPAPGGGQIEIFTNFARLGPVINNQKQVVFAAFQSSVGNAIFSVINGRMTRIAAAGDRAPRGGLFTVVDAPKLNAAGQIVFFGQTTVSGSGIFLYSAGRLSEIVQGGSRIGQSRIVRVDLPQINDNGNIAFTADLSNGDTAVFVAAPANVDGGEDAESDSDNAAPDCNLIHSLAIRDSRLVQERMGERGSERSGDRLIGRSGCNAISK